MKFLKKIALILLCGAALSAAPSQAVITNGAALTADKQVILSFGEIHWDHPANSAQLAHIMNLITMHKPEEVCVVVEAGTYPQVSAETAKKRDINQSIFNQLMYICREKNIEVIPVDFRKIYDEDGTKRSIDSITDSKKILSEEFIKIVIKQAKNINDIDSSIFSKEQSLFFYELCILCNKFIGKQLYDLYAACSKLTKDHILTFEAVDNFIDTLVNLRIVAEIKATKKQYVFIVAGRDHTQRVEQQLTKQYSYKNMLTTSTNELTEDDLDKILEEPGAEQEKAHLIPALDIEEFQKALSKKFPKPASALSDSDSKKDDDEQTESLSAEAQRAKEEGPLKKQKR